MALLDLDEKLLEIVIRSTEAGLQMAGVKPRAVGYSQIAPRPQQIAVVVGLVGRRNGTVTLGLSEMAVLHLANQFLQAELDDLTHEAYDAVGEVVNIVAGRLKGELGSEEYGITSISCPSIVVGGDYRMYQFRGFQTVSVEFELDGLPRAFLRDRLFSTTLSLSRG